MVSIREIRELTGLSQSAFAKKYDIPVASLRHWEIGQRQAPTYLVKLLERVVKEDIAQERD